jgi:hypothetical protein
MKKELNLRMLEISGTDFLDLDSIIKSVPMLDSFYGTICTVFMTPILLKIISKEQKLCLNLKSRFNHEPGKII